MNWGLELLQGMKQCFQSGRNRQKTTLNTVVMRMVSQSTLAREEWSFRDSAGMYQGAYQVSYGTLRIVSKQNYKY